MSDYHTAPGAGSGDYDDALLAVTAHGLLGPITSITFASQLLLERWDEIAEDERRYFLQVILDRSRFTGEVLKDLVRGLPGEATVLLDGLGVEAERRQQASRG
ncbi:MAG TPA: hypothetical protein VFA11_11705 [Acidimicrobiales bacterium]|nr:hypothetical protein [Acidimicrobiales bacterium]